jgi:Glycine zipper
MLAGALLFSGCETGGEGAKTGAIAGALIGGITQGDIRGAARGAAIGAGTGYLIGRAAERERRYGYYDDDPYYERRVGHRYPVARRTGRRGFVISPYPPHHVIDVRGIPSGARVIDPSNDRVFIRP